MLKLYITKKYLLIPIEDRSVDLNLYISVNDSKEGVYCSIKFAQNTIDYYIPLDVSKYLGQSIQMSFSPEIQSTYLLKEITQSDTFDVNSNEQYRPVFHYSPPYGWMNDPNGMVYKDGVYHLFYQYNPYGCIWGNMSWGHATSKDLLSWKDQPVAITPDELGVIYSGGAIVDKNNSSGFGKDALLLFYTSASTDEQSQCIAYSLDNGITIHKYINNPILKHDFYKDFRDPKVFWHSETNQWIMSLATSQVITFYSSTDLISWQKLSDFGNNIGSHGGVWECPDLFPLTHEGIKKWVLLVSINPGGPNGGNATQYFIGDFDGNSFKADNLDYPLWLDYGRDNYAGVTWENLHENKRILIGWMSNWDYANNVPSKYFRNAMTIPRELSLKSHKGAYLLTNYPIEEVKKLRSNKKEFILTPYKDKYEIENIVSENVKAYELNFLLSTKDNKTTKFSLKNNSNESFDFTFDFENKLFIVNRDLSGNIEFSDKFSIGNINSPLLLSESYNVRILVDVASVEIFINEGDTVQTNTIFPTKPYNKMEIESNNNILIKEIIVYEINSSKV